MCSLKVKDSTIINLDLVINFLKACLEFIAVNLIMGRLNFSHASWKVILILEVLVIAVEVLAFVLIIVIIDIGWLKVLVTYFFIYIFSLKVDLSL